MGTAVNLAKYSTQVWGPTQPRLKLIAIDLALETPIEQSLGKSLGLLAVSLGFLGTSAPFRSFLQNKRNFGSR
jgi:hypothetical protein